MIINLQREFLNAYPQDDFGTTRLLKGENVHTLQGLEFSVHSRGNHMYPVEVFWRGSRSVTCCKGSGCAATGYHKVERVVFLC